MTNRPYAVGTAWFPHSIPKDYHLVLNAVQYHNGGDEDKAAAADPDV